MIYFLLVSLSLAQVVPAISTNTTGTICVSPDGAPLRTLWSILSACGLTLLICIWQSIHFKVPDAEENCCETYFRRGLACVMTLLAPEATIASAVQDWWNAKRKVKEFREREYEWSMTHSFFAQMGGFVYPNSEGKLEKIDADEFLRRCRANEIANPVVTVKEIMDRSKSDALGKAVLIFQLLWFIIQTVARLLHGLVITLIEIDTLCMAVLTIILLLIWKEKPLRPDCPHIFYSLKEVEPLRGTPNLSEAWKSQPWCLCKLMAWCGCCCCRRKPRSNTEKTCSAKFQQLMEVKVLDSSAISVLFFCATGFIFGGLHLAAWNFDFATGAERNAWRTASVILMAGAPISIVIPYMSRCGKKLREGSSTVADPLGSESPEGPSAVVDHSVIRMLRLRIPLPASPALLLSRAVLLGLMFASLRSIPCAAYQTVSWTAYIPHF